MPTPVSLVIQAHAKLNLALAVGPPQPPKGYHPICSWFVPIALHDTLALERLPDGEPSRFTIRWASDAPKPSPIDWPTEKDLAVRAHAALERHAGRSLPVALTMNKRTPVGGGLGGGSSDAASMLLGLNTLFDLRLSRDQLASLSTPLGSDIAFFIDDRAIPRPALVSGLGDRIERLSSAPDARALLLIPAFGCPTGPVYQAFDRSPTANVDEPRVRALIDSAARSRIDATRLFNDLAEPACHVEPRLREALATARHALGPSTPVHVTGSGSTMFCLPRDLHAAMSALRAVRLDIVVLPTRILAAP